MYPGCYPGLYSLWGFAPPLTVTMAAAHSAGLFCFCCFAPSLLITLAAEHSAGLFSCSGFAPYCLYCDYYTLPWAVFPLGLRPVLARKHSCCTLHYSNIVPLLLVTMAAAIPDILLVHGMYCLPQQDFTSFHDTSVSFRVIPLLR